MIPSSVNDMLEKASSRILSARSMAGSAPDVGDAPQLLKLKSGSVSNVSNISISHVSPTRGLPLQLESEVSHYLQQYTAFEMEKRNVMEHVERCHPKDIPFQVTGWSSYSGTYHPQHILQDVPGDQCSRWSSASNNASQFLLLRLAHPTVLRTITFGKFHKAHVCNLKEFKIYVGIAEDNMIEVCHAGLRNDEYPESFALRYRSPDHLVIVSRFVRIVPLMTWSAGFNFSIWHVHVSGIVESPLIAHASALYKRSCEQAALQMLHHHFRVESNRSPLAPDFPPFQHPLAHRLYDAIQSDDVALSEYLLAYGYHSGLFDMRTRDLPFSAIRFEQRLPFSASPWPSPRAGHQMVFDQDARCLFLFGGFDGTRDLNDLWKYDVTTHQWHELPSRNGPPPSSCHQMCYDQKKRRLFVFGRYVDQEDNMSSHTVNTIIYLYDLLKGKESWEHLHAINPHEGPIDVLHEHAMVYDEAHHSLLISGGRTPPSADSESLYSGLFAFHLGRREWRCLRPAAEDTVGTEESIDDPQQQQQQQQQMMEGIEEDAQQQQQQQQQQRQGTERETFSAAMEDRDRDMVAWTPRSGHAMVMYQDKVYFFGGEYRRDFFCDMHVYARDRFVELMKDASKRGGPEPSCTLRATVDTDLGLIHVFTGLIKERSAVMEHLGLTIYTYHIARDEWKKVYPFQVSLHGTEEESHTTAKEGQPEGSSASCMAGSSCPLPRYAYHVIYDQQEKCHYLFGGNPGVNDMGAAGKSALTRLNDMWKIQWHRTSADALYRQARFHVRKLAFVDLCLKDKMEAVSYLQKEVSQVVDHENEEESVAFRQLATYLFASPDRGDATLSTPFMKQEVYERMMAMFPESMRVSNKPLTEMMQSFVFQM